MKENEVAVSVAMIAYNHGKYIRQALDSVFAQETSFKFEVIVGEDCSPSPDNSKEILLEYKQKYGDKLILVLHEKNVGGSMNSLSVRKLARGKYICVTECDDFWTDTSKLQRQYDILEANPQYSACGADNCYVSDDGVVVSKSNLTLRNDRLYTMKDYIKRGYTIHGNTLMCRRFLFPVDDAKYIELKKAAPTMGDISSFIILYEYGPIYVFKDVMLAHRDGSKNPTSFSAGQKDKYMYYTYMRIDIQKALEKYFDYKYDFSFLMINRLADGLLMKILYQNKMISDNNKLLEYINTLPFKTRIKIVMKAADMFMYKVIHKIKMIL